LATVSTSARGRPRAAVLSGALVLSVRACERVGATTPPDAQPLRNRRASAEFEKASNTSAASAAVMSERMSDPVIGTGQPIPEGLRARGECGANSIAHRSESLSAIPSCRLMGGGAGTLEDQTSLSTRFHDDHCRDRRGLLRLTARRASRVSRSIRARFAQQKRLSCRPRSAVPIFAVQR
jgi:hypothetical protein